MKSLFIAICLLISTPLYAQFDSDLITVNVEESSKATTPAEAFREMQTKVMNDVARDQVIEIIGEKRFEKNKKMVENKILREAPKFIPFVRKADPVQQSDGSWKAKFEIKVARGSLRQLVLESGLLSESDGQVSVLSMIGISDRTAGKSYRWWEHRSQTAPLYFLRVLREVNLTLASELNKAGFYLMMPPEQGFGIPPLAAQFGLDVQTSGDMRLVSLISRSPLIMTGDIKMRSSPVNPGSIQIVTKLTVQNVSLGRTAAEVSRFFETESGVPEQVIMSKLRTELPDLSRDLATQLLESWKRGALGASSLQLVVRPLMTPKKLSEFRTQLVRQVKEVKAVRERLFDQDQVTFDIDFAGGQGQQLAEKLRSAAWTGFSINVAEVKDQSVALDIKVQ